MRPFAPNAVNSSSNPFTFSPVERPPVFELTVYIHIIEEVFERETKAIMRILSKGRAV